MDDYLYKVSSSYRTCVDGLSNVIILDELGCLELRRHNDLRELKLSRSTLSRKLEPSMILIFSVRVST